MPATNRRMCCWVNCNHSWWRPLLFHEACELECPLAHCTPNNDPYMLYMVQIWTTIRPGKINRHSLDQWIFLQDANFQLWNNRFTNDIGGVPYVETTIPFPFINVTYRIKAIYRICKLISNTTGATCGAGSTYPSGASEFTPSFWWGSCCLFFSFCVVSCVLLFVLFRFSHGVVSLFSIYEFDCPSGIFRPSFQRSSAPLDTGYCMSVRKQRFPKWSSRTITSSY